MTAITASDNAAFHHTSQRSTNKMWIRHTKRMGIVALALVAILCGVAVAFFLQEKTVPNNSATGGNLILSTNLPLHFDSATSDRLYPTDRGVSDSISRDLTITNPNPVMVSYKLFSACAECSWPAGTTPTQAQLDKKNQWEHLYVRITPYEGRRDKDIYQQLDDNTDGAVNSANLGHPYQPWVYQGKLKDMDLQNKVELGCVMPTAAGATTATEKRWQIQLWLQNENVLQPMNVISNWEFTVDAQTPRTNESANGALTKNSCDTAKFNTNP